MFSLLTYVLPIMALAVLAYGILPHQKMYRIEPARYKQNRDFYIDLLDMSGFIDQPARQLSLGQKMRANLALSLLHDPDVVYLDEPTIGLDVVAKDRIRRFIREINQRNQTTVILTTHDMSDIESICQSLVLIDNGKILYAETHYSIRHDEMLPGEALTLLARQYEIIDIGVRETPIEEIIRDIYEKSGE